jgi:uncharacterized protein YndB with AHSA1/START domain
VIYDLRVQRVFDATPEEVFDAFTDPDAQKEWYQLDPDWTVETECDVRVGGVWKSAWGPPGSEPFREMCVFRVVDRPRRLVMTSTMTMPDGSSIDTELEITFEAEKNGKTRMTIVQSEFPTTESRDGFEGGWPGALERLAGVVHARISGSRWESSMS